MQNNTKNESSGPSFSFSSLLESISSWLQQPTVVQSSDNRQQKETEAPSLHDDGNTPLQTMIKEGRKEEIQKLLDSQETKERLVQLCSETNNYGCNIFHTCAFHKENIIMNFLFEYFEKKELSSFTKRLLSQQTKPQGHWTPLFISCSKGFLNICSSILTYDPSSINILDQEGRSSLMAACSNNHPSLVNLLLSFNPDLSPVDGKGRNALYFSCRNGNAEVVDYLMNHVINFIDDPHARQAFLDRKDFSGYTSLHMACLANNYPITQRLLDASADPSINASDGSTPLHILARKEEPDLRIAAALLTNTDPKKKGINIRKKGPFGQTILHELSRKYHADLLRVVLSASREMEQNNKNNTHGHEEKKRQTESEAEKGEEDQEEEDEEDEEERKKDLVELQDVDGLSPLHVAVTAWKYLSTEEIEKRKPRIFDVIHQLLFYDHVEGDDGSNISERKKRERKWERERKLYNRLNQKDFGNMTILQILIWKIDQPIITDIAKKLINYNNQTESSNHPLHWRDLNYNADVTLYEDGGWSVFHICQNNLMQKISKNKNEKNNQSNDGPTEVINEQAAALLSFFENHLEDRIQMLQQWIHDEEQYRETERDNKVETEINNETEKVKEGESVLEEWRRELQRMREFKDTLDLKKVRDTNNWRYRLKSAPQNQIPKKKRERVLKGEKNLKGIAALFKRHPHVSSQQEEKSNDNNRNEEQSKPNKGPLRVVILTGAGVSVSTGIPDYRGEKGIYRNKNQNNKETDQNNPEKVMWSGQMFQTEEDCENFYNGVDSMIYPTLQGKRKPSTAHYFISLLQQKGYLQRVYTQNIDLLHSLSGVSGDKLVEAHGSFRKFRCTDSKLEGCQYSIECDDLSKVIAYNRARERGPTTTLMTDLQMKPKDIEYCRVWQRIHNHQFPLCPVCQSTLRPDVVFFGEGLRSEFFQNKDFDLKRNCDLLIVMGTTLLVYPFASLVNEVSLLTPRLLINNEATGPWRPSFEETSKTNSSTPTDVPDQEFPPELKNPNEYRDVKYLGEIDQGVRELAKELGWEKDLDDLIESQQHLFQDS